MLQSPAKRARADAGAPHPPPSPQQDDFRQAAIDHLVTRLRDPRSPEAAAAPLRAALAPLEDELGSLLRNAVVGGQSASMLVIGEPGSGKTLVRRARRGAGEPGARASVWAGACVQ